MKIIWLSHLLNNETPLFGGRKDLDIRPGNSISRGDSCNTSYLHFPSHSGTHVDAPLHFIPDGASVDDYEAEEWIFTKVRVCHINVLPGQLIAPENIPLKDCSETDFLILKTGFEIYRGEDCYWENNPGVHPRAADYIVENCPKLKAVGMDLISVSGYAHRLEGRAAHTALLGAGLRIVEDMHLQPLEVNCHLSKAIVMPLRFTGAEGSPCTILGIIN